MCQGGRWVVAAPGLVAVVVVARRLPQAQVASAWVAAGLVESHLLVRRRLAALAAVAAGVACLLWAWRRLPAGAGALAAACLWRMVRNRTGLAAPVGHPAEWGAVAWRRAGKVAAAWRPQARMAAEPPAAVRRPMAAGAPVGVWLPAAVGRRTVPEIGRMAEVEPPALDLKALPEVG